jgi:hypothetical protein
MRSQEHFPGFVIRAALCWAGLGLGLVRGATTLPDRADVPAGQNPPGWDYDVYYNNDMASADFLPDVNAGWIRDAVLNSHNTFVGVPYSFLAPRFSALPNNICISSTASGCWANAPEDRINVNNCVNGQTEPFTRSVLVHEMFHHVQYAYINFNDWPAWGQWTVEGTPPAMEDRSRADLDGNAMNSRYVGDVGGHFGNPNVTLMDRVYDAAPFWNYIAEQFGTVTAEPARGADVIRNFWERTAGNSPDSVRYLRDTIGGFAPGRTLEDVFLDFAVANFTHDLDLSRLPAAQRARYAYIDESAAGGGTPYGPVMRTPVAMLNTTVNGNVVRWGAQYFEGNVARLGCQVVGVRGQARDNKILGWAVVGIRSGNRVSEIYRGIGNVFYKTFINDPSDNFERIALVVAGLNDAADFDYALGFGQLGGQITLPVTSAPAHVGRLGEPPERFQIRLRLQGPPVLTPEGLAPVSVRGIDASQLLINLRSRATGAVYPVTGIINADYVSGEYWIVAQAPVITNPGDGQFYDLEVCLCRVGTACEIRVTSPSSVIYDDVRLLQMIVLDRSYSMHYPEPAENAKITAAKNAARLAVDVLSDNDQVGFVTFSGNNSECDVVPDVQLVRPLTPVSPGVRDDFKMVAINNVVEDGWTSIGDGLKMGRDQLIPAPANPGDVKNILLLSDGLENEGDFWDRNNSACGTPGVKNSFDPVSGSAAGQRIDTIAFGSDADENLLQSIALFTPGGLFYAVMSDPPSSGAAAGFTAAAAGSAPSFSSLEVPNRLAQVYRNIEEELHHETRFHYRAFRLAGGAASPFVIPVTESDGGGIRQPVFVFNWHLESVAVDIKLFDRNGNLITATTPGWRIYEDKTHKTYHFGGTLAVGDYAVSAGANGDVQLVAMLSGKLVRGVTLDARISQPPPLAPNPECERIVGRRFNYLRGLPVEVSASLHDYKGGLAGLDIVAVVDNPDGSQNRLSLYDDGLHDNGVAGDGIYGNRYTRTPFARSGGSPDFPAVPLSNRPASYTVQLYASGKSHAGEPFERSVTRFFSVYEYDERNQELRICDPDTDNDGLPDRWEDLYGLDKNNPGDAAVDFDDDGLRNRDEFLQGTLPLNPDTDGGGESDGSEVANGRDPLFDRDDLLPAVIDYGVVNKLADVPLPFPLEPKAVILRFPVNTAYRFMQIWRTDANGFVFNLVARVNLGADRSGLYFDRGLETDAVYRYYLRAEGLSGAVTPATEVFSAVPKADPVPPDGAVVINGGAPFTTSPNVTLSLLASGDAASVLISQNSSFAGVGPLPMAATVPFTLAGPLPGPFVATVYVRYRDNDLNESIVYHDSVLVDANGDTDNDRLYDPWERTHFGNLSRGPAGDEDGDGVSNLEEFRNGTDPRNPCSPQCGVRSIRRAGAQIIIEYTGTLESAKQVEGPYEPVSGATSPYSLTPAPENRFFRAR